MGENIKNDRELIYNERFGWLTKINNVWHISWSDCSHVPPILTPIIDEQQDIDESRSDELVFFEVTDVKINKLKILSDDELIKRQELRKVRNVIFKELNLFLTNLDDDHINILTKKLKEYKLIKNE